jgi:tripartite-type tricarboxylate transporter receptor subunit TctC
MAEFLKLARAEPDRFTYASWGIASGAHIRTEAFNKESKIKIRHIPYQGSGPAFAAIVGQQVDVMMVPLGLAYSTAKAGKVKILGVDTLERVAEAPEIPTLAEQGLPGFEAISWFSLMGPANLPPDIQMRLNQLTRQALNNPEVKAKLLAGGLDPAPGSPQELSKLIATESSKWGRVIVKSGAKLEQ